MRKAYHSLVLHAHLPFVRHPEHEDFLEEDWLYEAVFETYLPLLQVLRGLREDRVPASLTFTLTPTLCEMLRDPLLQARCSRYLERGIEFCRRQEDLHSGEQRDLIRFYGDRYTEAFRFYEKGLSRDPVSAFAELQEDGVIEIATCAATHGFLPMLKEQPETVRAQVLIGRDSYREHFGRDPRGIWLPECAYYPGLESVLAEAGIRWFLVDAHGLIFGNPQPRFGFFAPYFTPDGPACFGRDRESSRQIWSQHEGYPGDPAYRDFYRDLGQDVPITQIREVYGADAHSRFTGIKLHRITGRTNAKQLYNRDWAMGAVDSHAGDFLRARMAQIGELAEKLPVDPILLSPFDAELFGHWWFEGPEFLNLYLRKAAFDQSVFLLTTPSAFLGDHPVQQVLQPSGSSWGHKGYWEVWLNDSNAWIYPHLHAAGRTMVRFAKRFKETCPPMAERYLRQMARELLLAQSSDWAFLIRAGTARSYAERRTREHLLRFQALHDSLLSDPADESNLDSLEKTDNLFPNLNWRYYA